MHNQATWACLLSRCATNSRDVWHWSKVCRASASACRSVRDIVAARFQKVNLYRWGWSQSLNTTSALLHGYRGKIDVHSGFFKIQRYSFGQPVKGTKSTIIPYREPCDFPQKLTKHLRDVSDDHAQIAWCRVVALLPFKTRQEYPENPPPQSTIVSVRSLLINAQTGQ